MKKKMTIIILTIILLFGVGNKVFAKSEVDMVADKKLIKQNDEFTISVGINNEPIAAYTIWIYFDKEKVECLDKKDSINIIDERIIYTWVSSNGKNQPLDGILDLRFKAKEQGSALFALVGEFYNQNGEKIDMNYNQLELQIGKNNNLDEQQISENEAEKQNKVINKSSAKLDIMRVGQEGIEPDFSPDVDEYYLVVGDNVKSLEITAIPENLNSNIKITGNDNLKNGLNTVKILVTSEDKTNKMEYIINVTKTKNVSDANTDLETLAIEGNVLLPEYKPNVTNYSVNVSKNTEKLNILAIPKDDKAKVEITGNDKLNTGDNIVKIKVIASNGITAKKYMINVHKRTSKEEDLKLQEEKEMINNVNELLEKKENEQSAKISDLKDDVENIELKNQLNSVISIGGAILAIMTIGIVIIRIVKK